jgi:hypothetical protein
MYAIGESGSSYILLICNTIGEGDDMIFVLLLPCRRLDHCALSESRDSGVTFTSKTSATDHETGETHRLPITLACSLA